MTKVVHSISNGKVDIDLTSGIVVKVYTQPASSNGSFACTDIPDCIHAATNKITPVDADEIGIWDSVTGLLNRLSFTNLKAFLKTYFDTLYITAATLAATLLGYLKLDQSAAQEITGGFPYYEDGHAAFTDQHQLVDKEYVDMAVLEIGARFFMLDAADGTVAAYKQTSMTASALATANVSASINASADTLIEEWISPAAMTFSKLQTGVYDLTVFAAKTAGNRVVRLFWRFYERLADGTEVMIAQSSLSEIVTAYSIFRIYATLSTEYIPTAGSRLVGKIYMQTTTGSQNTTTVLYYQGDEDSHWQIPANEDFLEDNFQAKLVSGTNIKTINSQSLLGATDIVSIQTVTITVANWSGGTTCTKLVAGLLITSAADIIIESQTEGDKWAGSNVYALPVTVDGQMDFTAESTPAANITFKVRIW